MRNIAWFFGVGEYKADEGTSVLYTRLSQKKFEQLHNPKRTQDRNDWGHSTAAETHNPSFAEK